MGYMTDDGQSARRFAAPGWRFTALWALLMAFAGASGAADHAPLPVRNQMPMSAALLDFVPISAEALGRGVWGGRLSFHAANMIAQEEENGVIMRMDVESHTVMADLAYGVTDRVTLRTAVGYRRHTGGFLDGFIEEVEDTLHLPTPWSRTHSENGETEWWIREGGGRTFERTDSTSGVTDLTLEADWQVSGQRGLRPATALRVALKLPTAPTHDALGTGGIDYGTGAAFSWEYGWWASHVNLDVAWLADHDGLAGTAFEETDLLRTATLSQVVAFGEWWDGVLQVEARNNPYRTEIESIFESLSAEVHLGARRRLAGGGNWFVAITENTMDKASPDFGVVVGIELRGGTGR
ncbi:MAG: DUF3187 family protein [Nitrospirota bacterium]|jgi:hypothetical protein